MRRKKQAGVSLLASPLLFLFAGLLLLYAYFLHDENGISLGAILDKQTPEIQKDADNATHVHTGSVKTDVENVADVADAEGAKRAERWVRNEERRRGHRRELHRRVVHDADTPEKGIQEEEKAVGKEGDRGEGASAATQAMPAKPPTPSAPATRAPQPAQPAAPVAPVVPVVPVVPVAAVRNVAAAKKAEDVNGTIPVGARTTGRLPDFHGSRGASIDGMLRGQNVTRISYTIFKIMKLFGFMSMVDSPAGAHAEWMPEMMQRMTYEQPSFLYKGVDIEEAGVERAKRGMGGVVDGEFFVKDVEKECVKGDIVFHWTEMDGSEKDARSVGYLRHVSKVFLAAKKVGNTYIVIGQYPRLNGPSPAYKHGRWVFAGNEKEDPFLYNEHVRGVVPMMSGSKAYMLYMTFYSLRGIPVESLEAV